MNQTVRLNKYLPVVILYFFFNSFLLPTGLLYTTLLTPLFIIWLLGSPAFKYIWLFFIFMTPFVIIHFLNGINSAFYIRSLLLFFSVWVFSVSFYQFIKKCNSVRELYKSILITNVFFVILAVIAFFIPLVVNIFWYTNPITASIDSMKRLKMLTYEPSYYSILFVPVALYYFLKMVVLKLPNPYITFFLIAVPLLLSLSFGVILGLILSLLFTFLWGFKIFYAGKKPGIYIISFTLIILIVMMLLMQLFPDNIFVIRLTNVLLGKDISFNGRTYDSFYLSWKIAGEKSLYFGTGLGQVKEVGLDFFKSFYNNANFTSSQIGIPNSMGDTLATFGIVGIICRLGLELYFFFKTRVYNNYYRLSLFMFIFIYQFTGSYIMNIAEYVIWIMAFSAGIFREFDKISVYRSKREDDSGHQAVVLMTV